MQKLKSIDYREIITILKCSLIGIVSTLIGTVIFAFVLKIANLSSTFICYINDIIRIFSIFIMTTCLKRKNVKNLMLKSLIGGVIYFLLSFVLFSILNGNFVFDITFLYNFIFSAVVSIIVAVIINLLSNKSV